MVGTRPTVGLKPVTPLKAAGMRTEPPVSVPIEISLVPSATDTPEPDDDPPGACAGLTAFPGVPKMRIEPEAGERRTPTC